MSGLDPLGQTGSRPWRDDPIEEFQRRWLGGPFPNVAAFLQEAGHLSPAQIVAILRVDQRLRWPTGRRVPAEDYLARHVPSNADPEAAPDLIFNEYRLLEESGEHPRKEEFLRRFPDHSAALEARIDLHLARHGEPTLAHGTERHFGRSIDDALAPSTKSPAQSSFPSVPGYEIEGELGRGGMGVVYKARQVGLNRLCALKMILHGGHAGEDDLARFRTEAKAIARLQHPNIVQVFEVGEYQDTPFFSLEYCSGGSLDRKLNGTPIESKEASQLLRALALAVQAAHQAKVIHRDLKPGNVLLQNPSPQPPPPQGEGVKDRRQPFPAPPLRFGEGAGGRGSSLIPKITDFGLAKKLDEVGHTQTGAIMGTPSYMAPEQAQGKKDIGPAADIYALGAILYECLTGRPPFKSATPFDTIMQVIADEPVPPSHLQPRTPRDLETICLKCLHKQPEGRYLTAQSLADDIGRFLDGEPITAKPVGTLERGWKWIKRHPSTAGLGVATLIAALALVAFLVSRSYQGRLAETNERLEAALGEANRARLREEELKKQTEQALDRVELYRYFNLIALANREIHGHDLRRASELLDETAESLRGWEWLYLRRRAHIPRKNWRRLPSRVLCLAYSRDGQRLAAGLRNGSVQVHDDDQRNETKFLVPAHKGPVHAVSFSPDNLILASGGEDHVVRIVELTNRKDFFGANKPRELFQQRHLLGHHTRPVRALRYSPGNNLLATGADDGKVCLWETTGANPARTLGQHVAGVRSLAFSSDGKRLASGGSDRIIKVWDVVTGKLLVAFPPLTAPVSSIAWIAQDKQIAAGVDQVGQRGEIFLHNSNGIGSPIVLSGHPAGILSLATNSSNVRLASAGRDGTVRLWSPDARLPAVVLGGHSGSATSVVFRPDGTALASGGGELNRQGEIKVWNLATPSAPRLFPGHSGKVTSLAFNPDGQRLASAGEDGKAIVQEMTTGRVLFTIDAHKGARATGIALSPDLQRLATGGSDGKVCLWVASTGALEKRLDGHQKSVHAVAFSPDGKQLASVGGDGLVRLHDTDSGRLLRSLPIESGQVGSVAFSPDGRFIASSSRNRVRLLETATGTRVHDFADQGSEITSVAFSPDGKTLAAACLGRDVWLHDVATGKRRHLLSGHSGGVLGVAFLGDGSRLATCGADGLVKLWDTRSGLEALDLTGHPRGCLAVAFSPRGVLAVGNAAGSITIHEPADKKNLPDENDDRP